MRFLSLVIIVAVLAGVSACLKGPEVVAVENPYGGEVREIVHLEGSRERESGLLRTIHVFDRQGLKRRQIDYFAENHPLRLSRGVFRVEANYDETGSRAIEILTYDEKGAFIESIIPVSQ